MTKVISQKTCRGWFRVRIRVRIWDRIRVRIGIRIKRREWRASTNQRKCNCYGWCCRDFCCNTINILEAAEKDEREDSEKYPFVFSGIPICDLAKTIFMKKQRDLSPLQFLDDGNIKNIAAVVWSNILTQDLCASQITKEAKFKEIELAIIQFVLDNCICCSHLPFCM